MKIITILGTRPEIIKLSALLPSLDQQHEHKLIHTGQHYDYNMDKVFFEELHLKTPDYSLNVGSHHQGKQTGLMLHKIEEVFLAEKPELVIVQGDTNTTLAGALAASKMHIPILHIEGGCRSFNRKMPEEINRVIVDNISNYLVVSDEKSLKNLQDEGIWKNTFHLGSTAFEAASRNSQFARKELLTELDLQSNNYVLVTLHRAENTNDVGRLRTLVGALNQVSEITNLVFSIHPRTKRILEDNQIELNPKIKVIPPQPYLSFLALLSSSKFCMSDSGGIQEEALVFNVPCLILRNETEWKHLVDAGKNILLGTDTERIVSMANRLLKNEEELIQIKSIEYPIDTDVSETIMLLIKDIEINAEGKKN
jgi:UDP-N-acetylglucosamine 2-epimerase